MLANLGKKAKAKNSAFLLLAVGMDPHLCHQLRFLKNDQVNGEVAGPELPLGIDNARMAEDRHGDVVLVGGSSSSNDYLVSSSLWGSRCTMDPDGSEAEMVMSHFLVPDHIADCWFAIVKKCWIKITLYFSKTVLIEHKQMWDQTKKQKFTNFSNEQMI